MGRAAILAGLDAAAWAGVAIFSRDGTSVTPPALATMQDLGHYPDVVAFLNGWACSRDLGAAINTQWAAALGGSIRCGISSANLFYLEFFGAASASMSVLSGPYDPWGWGVASVAGVNLGGNVRRCTATLPWTRGQCYSIEDARFLLTVNATSIIAPLYRSRVHSLPTFLAGPTTSDMDEVTETLEKWDNAACDATLKRYRWGLDNEGRAFTSWDTALTSAKTVTWASATFRRAMGFTGSESVVLGDGYYTLTATYPSRGVQILRNGLVQLDPSISHRGTAMDTQDARVVGRSVSVLREIEIASTLRGGVGLAESRAAYEDEAENYRHRVAPYLFRSARCTVVPEWGDPRIGQSVIGQFNAGDSTPATYSTYIRGDAGGVMGRRRCEVSPETAAQHAMSFAPNAPRTRTGRISWRLRLLDG